MNIMGILGLDCFDTVFFLFFLNLFQINRTKCAGISWGQSNWYNHQTTQVSNQPPFKIKQPQQEFNTLVFLLDTWMYIYVVNYGIVIKMYIPVNSILHFGISQKSVLIWDVLFLEFFSMKEVESLRNLASFVFVKVWQYNLNWQFNVNL